MSITTKKPTGPQAAGLSSKDRRGSALNRKTISLNDEDDADW